MKKIKKSAFSCKRGNFTVRGYEYKLRENSGIPVVLSHGFLANQKIMKKYAKALAEAGYVAFTYDFCGGALLGKSDGKFSDMSIDTEKDDLKAVVAYTRTLEGLRHDRLVLLGASQGGFVSCLVAAEWKDAVDRLVLLYPALCIPDDAKKGKMLTLTFDPADIEGTLRSKPFRFSAEYPRSAMGIDIYAEIAKIDAPVLIVHGDADKIVSPGYSERAVAVAPNKNSELAVLKGAKHGFNKKQYREATDRAVAFLRKNSR